MPGNNSSLLAGGRSYVSCDCRQVINYICLTFVWLHLCVCVDLVGNC